MTERKALLDKNETPEDVASLYSWANLHGAKYRDFSASRAQSREKARQRVQQALEQEHEQAHREVPAVQTPVQPEAQGVGESAAEVPPFRTAEEKVSAPSSGPAPTVPMAAPRFSSAVQSVTSEVPEESAVRKTAWPAPTAVSQPNTAFMPGSRDASGATPSFQPSAPYESWGGDEAPEAAARPAWLNTDRVNASVRTVPQAASSDDTLLGTRDRLTSRWFALKSVLQGAAASAEQVPSQAVSHAPVVAVFSLAGGVGKTSLVATLGRALSARGERVLLVDTASYGLLPFYFGARDQRPGQLRTFTPPGESGDAPIQMIAIDPENLGPETASQEPLTAEIGKYAGGVARVIVDLATASGATTRRVLRMAPLVLVPVTPDMNSVVSVHAIESFFQRAGSSAMPYYVLNQFDPSLPLHLDVREVLREQLGERLLPFAVRRTQVVSEALAEGMTVMDYAPTSAVAEDFGNLAGWLKSQSAPASTSFRGVRWSER